MYLLEFVNSVRTAQGLEGLDRLPGWPAAAREVLERAMGCRLERGIMRMRSAEDAAAVAEATGLPLGLDRSSVALPPSLGPQGADLAAARPPHGLPAIGG